MEQIFLFTKRLMDCKLDSFKDIYEKVDHLFDNELNDIKNIRKQIYRQFDEHRNRNQKCSVKSMQYRNEGDIKFKSDSFEDALDLYNSAVMCASYPLRSDDEPDDELCNAFKSRSKTFLQMENYGNALYDIECAILLLSHHQVMARIELMLVKVNCLKHLNRIDEARQLVSTIIELIPCYPANKQLVLDAIDLKESLASNQSQSGTQLLENETNMIKLCEELGDWTHNSCQLSIISGKGRHYVASDPISDKTIVMVEKSFAEVLFMNQLGTHCGNCFKNIGYQYWPCRHCSQVIFCSSQCAKQAYYHSFECGVTELIDKLGPTHYLVFRIFLRIGTENVLKLLPYIDSSGNLDDLENIDESKELRNYLRFMQLMDHTENHDISLKVVALVGSIQLTFILEYLKQIKCKTGHKLEMRKTLTKTLILHFFKATINAFGIYERQLGSSNNSEHIGNAMCLKTSFFNHSCDPNIYWHFNGTCVTSITNRHINRGEELTITYGPLYTIPVNERQSLLKTKYFFTCDCHCCVSDSKQVLILKCFNSQTVCSGQIVCNRESAKARCLKCSKMFEIAKTIEDIDRSKNQFDFIISEFQCYQNLTDQSKSYLLSAENFHKEFSEILDDKCEIMIEIRTKLSRSYQKIGDYSKAMNLSKQVLRSIDDDKQSLNYYKEIIYLSQVFYLYLFHQKESLTFDNDCQDCVSIISETVEKLKHCKNCLLENLVHSNLESHEKQARDKRLNVIENLLSIKQKHMDNVLKLKDN